MLRRMVHKAVEEKVQPSKVIDTFRDAYDYIIGKINCIAFIAVSTS